MPACRDETEVAPPGPPRPRTYETILCFEDQRLAKLILPGRLAPERARRKEVQTHPWLGFQMGAAGGTRASWSASRPAGRPVSPESEAAPLRPGRSVGCVPPGRSVGQPAGRPEVGCVVGR